MRFLSGIMFAAIALWATGIVGVASSQEQMEASGTLQPVEQSLTVEQVELLRKEAAESADLDDEAKKKVAEIYRSALAELQRAADLKARAAEFKTDSAAIENRKTRTEQQLGELKGKEPPPLGKLAVADLEQELSTLGIHLDAQKKKQAAAEAELKNRAQRSKDIRTRLVALPDKMAEIAKQAESLPSDENPLFARARKIDLAARRIALEREAPALENELAKYKAEDAVDLVRLQRDLCVQEVAFSEKCRLLLEAKLKKERALAAERDVLRAREEAIDADPVLKSYAKRNRELTELAKAITVEFEIADKDLQAAKQVHETLLSQFEQTRKKVESVGLTSAVGALLRKQSADLPDARQRRSSVHGRREEIDETHFELFEYDDEREELSNPDLLVKQIVARAGNRSTLEPLMLESAAHDLLDRKREYLDALIRNYNKYFDTLVELDTTEQQIIELVDTYQQYIDERVLWIRSGHILTSELELDQSDAWFTSVSRWSEVPDRLSSDLRTNPIPYSLTLFAFGVLLVRARKMRFELQEIGDLVRKPTCYEFGPTARAIVLTVGISAVWPGLIGFIAWRLSLAPDHSPFAKAIGLGLLGVCAMWFPLELFRQTCGPQGLASAHFGWPSSATKLLRKNLRWFIRLGLPLTFLTTTLFASDATHGHDAVERICFIIEAAVIAMFLYRILRPSGGVFEEYIAYHQGGWIDRLKYIWAWLGVSSPLLIAGLAFLGYYYTAHILSARLYTTISFVATLVLVRAILSRLILLRRRKLSIEQIRERTSAAAQSTEPAATSAPAGIVTGKPQTDLSIHSVQTQRLLTTGMLATTLVGFWLIWVDVLPALTMLDKWPLWTTSTSIHVVEQEPPLEESSLPGGEATGSVATTRIEYEKTSVTFSDAALAIMIAIITFMSAKNVPGLLEMSVLQRLPLDASVRYAITTLVSYGIILLGVVVACSTIGLRWSQIQWLVTALTFGLAFGLQEIFANFIAGLIILFERPVRVGDVVTVDDVTGVVSRIRIRATSITNWDRKEYVVPNKEFITGRLLNWTLSDKTNRIVVSIGIAYGSNTELARELLLKVANEHPMVLAEPPSVATLEGFGDNALNFTLRAFLPTMDHRLQVIHELHTGIDKAFREAKIEIAFPQRDLHIRTTPQALNLAPPISDAADHDRHEAA